MLDIWFRRRGEASYACAADVSNPSYADPCSDVDVSNGIAGLDETAYTLVAEDVFGATKVARCEVEVGAADAGAGELEEDVGWL